jgi:hypothetical protein
MSKYGNSLLVPESASSKTIPLQIKKLTKVKQNWDRSKKKYLVVGIGVPVPSHELIQHGRQLLGSHVVLYLLTPDIRKLTAL